MSAPAIELRDVFRIHPSERAASVALAGLTMAVAPGEVVVVRGPSGSGKTTLLRILAALDRPSAGSVRVLGADPAQLGARAAARFRAERVGMLDQHYARALSPHLTCAELIALTPSLRGAAPAAARARALELLARVGLPDRADALPSELSGGEQQRVAVCAAIAHRPGLLLADEPAGELDEAAARTVYALLGELVREQGATAVIVSHDRASEGIADRVLGIRDGRLSDEAERTGEPRLVVGRGGWIRLPEALRRDAALGGRAQASAGGDGLLLQPAAAPEGLEPEPAPMPAAPAGSAVVAEVRGVSRAYGDGSGARTVLGGLDAVFRAGRMTAVVGRSGSGKSTLVHLLAGLERPTAGSVVVAGVDLAGLDRRGLAAHRRAHVGLVTQEPGLTGTLTATENVELGLALRRAPGDRVAQARAALREVGLEHRLDGRAATLSAGERQRVAIARALAAAPALLLLDEPTARIDEESARSAVRLLLGLARARGLAVVCATHDPIAVEAADDAIAL